MARGPFNAAGAQDGSGDDRNGGDATTNHNFSLPRGRRQRGVHDANAPRVSEDATQPQPGMSLPIIPSTSWTWQTKVVRVEGMMKEKLTVLSGSTAT